MFGFRFLSTSVNAEVDTRQHVANDRGNKLPTIRFLMPNILFIFGFTYPRKYKRNFPSRFQVSMICIDCSR